MTRNSKRRETEGFEGGVWWKGQKRVRPNACSLHRCAFGKLDRQDHRLDITGNARCKELEESREVESGRERRIVGRRSGHCGGKTSLEPPVALFLSPHHIYSLNSQHVTNTSAATASSTMGCCAQLPHAAPLKGRI
jgi:hypothetical protein